MTPQPRSILGKERYFVMEGDLVKKCQSGKSVSYRFFLFSDQLVYTHRAFSGEYKVHKQLLLSVLRCEDIDDNPTAFRILHPLKSFAVTAESPQAKTQWVRVLSQTANTARPKPSELNLDEGASSEGPEPQTEEEDLERRSSIILTENERRSSVNL
mmetsp:Transcript_55340/g.152351  ORF Transcript_55340/g.152351 Transcript_55340/m.152351 type:complete len:156 (+) Transcript_55340:336-803(+)